MRTASPSVSASTVMRVWACWDCMTGSATIPRCRASWVDTSTSSEYTVMHATLLICTPVVHTGRLSTPVDRPVHTPPAIMGAMTDTAPARWIDYIPLDDIKFAARNPKGHDITGIGGSIDTHGMGELPLVDERTGQLVAGHGRIEALRARHKAGGAPPDGLTVRDDGMWLAPVVRGWSSKSDPAAESYLIGSNQWTVIGGWDDLDELGRMLSALADTDAALLAATGYTEDDIAKLLGTIDDDEKPVALTDQDDAPGLRTATIAQTGDLWHLGPHRLVVGDATKEANWELLLGGDHADMMWTDPPYGVSYQAGLTPAEAKRQHRRTDGLEVSNDDLTSCRRGR